MSPIIARAATRAAARRQFSIMRTLREGARQFEPHPFQRLSVKGSQSMDYGKAVKRVATQAAIYFPGFGLVLGWPKLAQMAFDGHM